MEENGRTVENYKNLCKKFWKLKNKPYICNRKTKQTD